MASTEHGNNELLLGVGVPNSSKNKCIIKTPIRQSYPIFHYFFFFIELRLSLIGLYIYIYVMITTTCFRIQVFSEDQHIVLILCIKINRVNSINSTSCNNAKC